MVRVGACPQYETLSSGMTIVHSMHLREVSYIQNIKSNKSLGPENGSSLSNTPANSSIFIIIKWQYFIIKI